MADSDRLRLRSRLSGSLLGIALTMAPHGALAATQARLVHCGSDTCLRLSGHRPNPGVAIRVAGHDLPVEGGNAWHATLPIATARDWASASGATMLLTLADERTGRDGSEVVALPPGALGRRIEIASLMVRAH
jgi:hypothetical protein